MLNRFPIWPSARRGWLSVLLSFGALAMALSWLMLPPAHTPLARAAGTRAPDFVTQTPDGRTVRLSAYRGRPVLLNFFSTTCPVSAAVVDNLNHLQAERPDVIVLSVNLNGASVADIAAWGTHHGARYPLLADASRTVANLYRPYATPFWVFIRPDGVIAAVRLGEHAAHNLAYRVNEYLPMAVAAQSRRGR